jgi:hypothetical protein
MFVVRITVDEDRVDFKAFTRKEDARQRYYGCWTRTDEGEFEDLALFEVVGCDDVREAIEAVKRGDRSVLLLDHKQPLDVEVAKLAIDVKLD